MNSIAIETRHLARRLGQHQAVSDVSLSVPEGSVYALLGRNGSGKTTTLKMLLGLLRADRGSIRILGCDPQRERLRTARLTGALLEAHGFYTQLTGAENLDIARRLLGLGEGEIARVLRLTGLDERAARLRVGGYSLGMRQRLGIARALLGAPRLLILDEPGNGLDPDGIADMRRFLRTLPERTGATVMISSHQLSEVEQTATHVGVIHDGRLVVEGPLATLKSAAAPELRIATSDDTRACQIAERMGYQIIAGAEPVLLREPASRGGAEARAGLNRHLVEAGIDVFLLQPGSASLESIYRHATGQDAPAIPLERVA
ncbi:MAG: ATP-binding cassette domain-containing protein [Glycocaulis sp.]